MFAGMRSTGRIAYVVAQHMAHDGHSELVVRLIQRQSALPVVLAKAGMSLQADTVYIIPSGVDGRVDNTLLTLAQPKPEHFSTPSINALFTSIAEAYREKAIGIVLSGAGFDGVAGCRAIKAHGGLTLAQSPEDAKFSGIVSAAIEARVIDRILPTGQMGEVLANLFSGLSAPLKPSAALAAGASVSIDGAPCRELELLLPQIQKATGIDFSNYKEETLLRRLQKRKAALGVSSPEAYQDLILREPQELQTLQHLFLVSVSSFFRDRDSFHELERALALLIADKPAGEPVRIWVPGCASGEEAYTLAIILRELQGDGINSHPLSMIATDLNHEALATAEAGVYRQSAFREMEKPLQERYFISEGHHLAVSPELKTWIRFELRDVLGAAPMTNLDLVSCRNLLIYMKSNLQDRLIALFHHVLRSQGLLFIGRSESLSFADNTLFIAIDHYHRLFRRRR